MKRTALIACFLLIFLTYFAIAGSPAQADTHSLLIKMKKAFSNFEDAGYTLTLQHRMRGRLRPAEIIEIKCTKDGAIFAKWTGKRHRNRIILYKPGWNNNQAWIMEGGALAFAAVSIPVNDKIIKRDYRNSIEYLAIGKILEQIDSVDPGNLDLTLDSMGIPQKAVLKDQSGRVVESYEFKNFKMNPGFAANQFDVHNSALGFPGYSTDGIVIDAVQLKSTLLGNYAKVKDYTCVMHKRERIKGKVQPYHDMFTKFRKPMDIYMKWVGGPYTGREVMYRPGHYDNKLVAHDAGIKGIITVKLDPNGSLARADSNHSIEETDLGHTVQTIYNNLSRGLENNDIKLKFLGLQKIGKMDVYVVESWMTKGKGYYSYHSINAHDVTTGLPMKSVNYDENDELFESFEWREFKPNVGLTDEDFNIENPDYNF